MGRNVVFILRQWGAMEDSEQERDMTCLELESVDRGRIDSLRVQDGASNWLSPVTCPYSSCKGGWKPSFIFPASYVESRICSYSREFSKHQKEIQVLDS